MAEVLPEACWAAVLESCGAHGVAVCACVSRSLRRAASAAGRALAARSGEPGFSSLAATAAAQRNWARGEARRRALVGGSALILDVAAAGDLAVGAAFGGREVHVWRGGANHRELSAALSAEVSHRRGSRLRVATDGVVVAAARPGVVAAFRASEREGAERVPLHDLAAAFADDEAAVVAVGGGWILVAGVNGAAARWSADGGQPAWRSRKAVRGGTVVQAACCRAAIALASLEELVVYGTQEGAAGDAGPMSRVDLDMPATALAFGPTGALAAGDMHGYVTVWEAEDVRRGRCDAKKQVLMNGHESNVCAVAFCGVNTVVSASVDGRGTVVAWALQDDAHLGVHQGEGNLLELDLPGCVSVALTPVTAVASHDFGLPFLLDFAQPGLAS